MQPQLQYDDWILNPSNNLWFRQVNCLSGEFELFFVVFTFQTPEFLYCQYPPAPGNPPPITGPPGCYWCRCPILDLALFSVLEAEFRSPSLEVCLPNFPPAGPTPAVYPPTTISMSQLDPKLPPGVPLPQV